MRQRTLVVALFFVGLFGSVPVFAVQDNSFLYRATVGMFEDQYDFFKYSPAYLASFKKSILWSQFSNLETYNDQLFNGTSGNNFWLFGGELPVGPGRAGLILDWFSASAPQANRHYAENVNHTGYGEITNIEYRDRDANGTIDYMRQQYGRSDAESNQTSTDIYAAYALGGVMGFDAGFALRATIDAYAPTYDGNLNYTAQPRITFNEVGQERQTDLLTGAPLYNFDEATGGSWNYSYTTIKAILALRSLSLLPKTDLVLNLAPIFKYTTNALTWTYNSYQDLAPGSPTTVTNLTNNWNVTGIENNGGPKPFNGFGVQADARADYQWGEGVVVTGQASLVTNAYTYSDAKMDVNQQWIDQRTVFVNPLTVLQNTSANSTTAYTTDGEGGDTFFGIKLRAQIPTKNWKLGIGLNASEQESDYNYSQTATTNNVVRFVSGTGNPASDYTQVRTLGTVTQYTGKTVIDTLEFPIGIVYPVLKNIDLQVGAKHTVQVTSTYNDSQVTSRTPDQTTWTYDNGNVTSAMTVPAANNDAVRTGSVTTTHANTLTYGATWWPFEDTQVDVAGFASLLTLTGYRISLTIYF